MSRIDDFLEMLDSYEGRNYQPKLPDRILTEREIDLVYACLCNTFSPNEKYLGYIVLPSSSIGVPRIYNVGDALQTPEGNMQAIISLIQEQNAQLFGIVYYTGDIDPLTFIKDETPSKLKSVPEGIETPDLMLIIDQEMKYIMFKGNEMHSNIDEGFGT